jgi:hypothetical protein
MMMMDARRFAFDAAAHQPGYRTDDARYLAAYRRYCADAALPSERVSDADARAAARDARDAMIERATTAWCDPVDARRKKPPDDDDNDDDDDDNGRSRRSSASDTRAAATAEYHRMCARLRDSWRSGPTDAAQPDTGSSPAEWYRHQHPDPHAGEADPGDPATTLRRHLSTESGAEAQAKKDRAWQEYRNRLSSAWKNPPGVMHPQPTKAGAGPSAFVAATESPDPAVRARQIAALARRNPGATPSQSAVIGPGPGAAVGHAGRTVIGAGPGPAVGYGK